METRTKQKIMKKRDDAAETPRIFSNKEARRRGLHKHGGKIGLLKK
tara:strand:- start:654 stop:791 length:138 start_codon:yes stop_codon:yes gene_type:complete